MSDTVERGMRTEQKYNVATPSTITPHRNSRLKRADKERIYMFTPLNSSKQRMRPQKGLFADTVSPLRHTWIVMVPVHYSYSPTMFIYRHIVIIEHSSCKQNGCHVSSELHGEA